MKGTIKQNPLLIIKTIIAIPNEENRLEGFKIQKDLTSLIQQMAKELSGRQKEIAEDLASLRTTNVLNRKDPPCHGGPQYINLLRGFAYKTPCQFIVVINFKQNTGVVAEYEIDF